MGVRERVRQEVWGGECTTGGYGGGDLVPTIRRRLKYGTPVTAPWGSRRSHSASCETWVCETCHILSTLLFCLRMCTWRLRIYYVTFTILGGQTNAPLRHHAKSGNTCQGIN